jgi:hypothetical protein
VRLHDFYMYEDYFVSSDEKKSNFLIFGFLQNNKLNYIT